MRDISKRIKQLRKERGITQSALAEKLCVTRQAVSNWETQKTRPDIEMLEKMADVFEIELTEFLYGAERREKNRKHIKLSIVLGVLLFASTILSILSSGRNMAVIMNTGHADLMFVLSHIKPYARIAMYGLLIPFVLSIVSVWHNISIKNRLIKLLLFTLGIVVAFLYIVPWSLRFLWDYSVQSVLFRTMEIIGIYLVGNMNFWFMVPAGALVYLGIDRKTEVS